MGVRLPSVASTALVNTTPVNGNETVILTSPPLNIALDFAQILIFWAIYISAIGATTTLAQAKIKRGTTVAGTQLGFSFAGQATPGSQLSLSGCYIDTPGAVAGQQYTITLTMIGASANSTVTDGCIILSSL